MPLTSWFPIPSDSQFSLENIPFGIISTSSASHPHPAVAVGEYVLDLRVFAENNGFSALSTIQPFQDAFAQPTLNAFAALGRPVHTVVRKYIQSLFLQDTPYPHLLRDDEDLQQQALILQENVRMHLPMSIGDYTDFYAGLHHAHNVGLLLRGPANALQPNYKHLPVGYHGRASSVVVSGTPIRRPWGQILGNPAAAEKCPAFSPCKRLDMELELGAFLCKENRLGEPVDINDAEDYIFGYVLLNDWSARDVQAWEYVPLGPFTAKNFGTSISPWVVLPDALEPFRTRGLDNSVELLPYLQEQRKENVYDIHLEVELKTSSGHNTNITRTSSRNLLFSFPQMIAHHSVTGCNMRVGDILGSGTISGKEEGSQGSLLERSQGGKKTLDLGDGKSRGFLEDGDEITIRGWCGESGGIVGFGTCVGRIEPARGLQ